MSLNIEGGLSGALSGASTGAALGSVVPGIGTAAGAIGGGILGLFKGMTGMSDKEKMKRAWEYEKEAMGLQYQYGQQAADAQQQRNLEMWNETNFEAQRKHMENAGLSVGLMYGNGGAMAASSAGGNPTQPSGPTSNPMAIMLQSKAIESQINLNNAQAAKAAAEAQKTSGVDTKEGYSKIGVNDATIENLIAKTANEKEQKKVIQAQARLQQTAADLNEELINYKETERGEIQARIKNLNEDTNKLIAEVDGINTDNEIKRKAKESIIAQQRLTVAQMIKNLTKTNAEIESIQAGIKFMEDNIEIKREGNKIQWTNLEKQVEMFYDKLGIEKSKITQEYIRMGVELVGGLLKSSINAGMMMGMLFGG